MHDEIDARLWVEQHEAFTHSVDRFLHAVWHGFKRLSARQYAAPWKTARPAKTKGPHACA